MWRQYTNCCYCEKRLLFQGEITKEHLIPKSHGGTNEPDNIRPCCRACNCARGSKPYDAWLAEIDNVLANKFLTTAKRNYYLKVSCNIKKFQAYLGDKAKIAEKKAAEPVINFDVYDGYRFKKYPSVTPIYLQRGVFWKRDYAKEQSILDEREKAKAFNRLDKKMVN